MSRLPIVLLTVQDSPTSALDYLGPLVLMVLVFALAYGGTRLLARRPHLNRRTSQLKVVERLSLGKDRELLLVRVGEKHFLAGMTAHSITLGESVELPDFASVLDPLVTSPEPSPSVYPLLTATLVTWIAQGKDRLHAFIRHVANRR